MVLETILDIEFQDMVAGDKAIFYQVQQLNSFFILSMMFRVVLLTGPPNFLFQNEKPTQPTRSFLTLEK